MKIERPELIISRRGFLSGLALGGGALATSSLFYNTPGAFAEELLKTPQQGEGPFYPDKLPLDTDNDLIVINEKITPAVGKITHLSGRVLDVKGKPVQGAVVEIWQSDTNGSYIHTKGRKAKVDGNFQGFGRFLTGRKGEYYFRTIQPVRYSGRTPHIHFLVRKGKDRLLTSEFYIKGEKRNAKDPVFSRIKGKKAQELVLVKFRPMKGSKTGELVAKADIIVGLTPEAEA